MLNTYTQAAILTRMKAMDTLQISNRRTREANVCQKASVLLKTEDYS